MNDSRDDLSGGYAESKFVAEFYDRIPQHEGREDVAFYVECARSYGGPVLELGCGTGRVMIPTAHAGLSIVGLDGSAAMIEVCRKNLAKEPPDVRDRVRLVTGNMTGFALDEQFSLVTIPFRPFQHIATAEGQISCLSAVHRHLSPGGHLVFDLFNPDLEYLTDESKLKEYGEPVEFALPDGRRAYRMQRTARRDRHNQVNDEEVIYYITHPDGRKERRVHSFKMRHLFRYEVEHLLCRCGFDLLAVYADFQKNPYGSKYPGDLVIVARKKG